MCHVVHKPGSTRAKRPFAVGVAAAVLATAAAVRAPAVAQDKPSLEEATRQLEERKRELDATREKEETLARTRETLAQERAELNEKLIATAARIQASEAKLLQIEERLEQLQGQEAILRGSIAQRHESIAKLLAAMQSIGHEPPPALVTRRDDALEMVRSAMLLATIFPELKFQADSLADDLQDLVRLGDGIRQEREAQQAETDKLNAEQLRIAGLIEEKKARLAANRTELARIREAARRHASEVTYLGDLLKRMNKEFKAAEIGLEKYERELAAERERQRRQPKAGTIELRPEEKTKVAFLSPGRIKPGIAFGEAKGILPMPVRGSTLVNYGDKQPHGGRSEGQWVRTRKNAQVVSPADGWIVFAGEFRSYGQLLIIDTGGGYHVLLAGMKRIDVDVGQFVLASEPVAVMASPASEDGQSGEESRPSLYIEFRKDGRPVNPAPWWAKTPEKVQG
jgi:septal ring factor EnvC (AmiA/AmiB activator)